MIISTALSGKMYAKVKIQQKNITVYMINRYFILSPPAVHFIGENHSRPKIATVNLIYYKTTLGSA